MSSTQVYKASQLSIHVAITVPIHSLLSEDNRKTRRQHHLTMLNSRALLGLAIIILYAPALLASFWPLFRHGRPRRAWVFLVILSASKSLDFPFT